MKTFWIEKDKIAGDCLNSFLAEQPTDSPLYGISSKLLRQLIVLGMELKFKPQAMPEDEKNTMYEIFAKANEYADYWQKQAKLSDRVRDKIYIAFVRAYSSCKDDLKSKPQAISLPSDEEIKKVEVQYANGNYAHAGKCFNDGAKWMRSQAKAIDLREVLKDFFEWDEKHGVEFSDLPQESYIKEYLKQRKQ